MIQKSAAVEIRCEKATPKPEHTETAMCIISKKDNRAPSIDRRNQKNTEGDFLGLEEDATIPIIMSACGRNLENRKESMLVMKGKVNAHLVSTLRDNRFSGVLVKKKYVEQEQ